MIEQNMLNIELDKNYIEDNLGFGVIKAPYTPKRVDRLGHIMMV